MILPKKKREAISHLHKTLLAELKLKCAECLRVLIKNDQLEPVKQIDVVAAIKNSIQILTLKLNFEDTLKKEYKENFELIPHANLLPSSETAHIQLKDTFQHDNIVFLISFRNISPLSSRNI
jgi:hypothetical protein